LLLNKCPLRQASLSELEDCVRTVSTYYEGQATVRVLVFGSSGDPADSSKEQNGDLRRRH
jgi:hypothetical protein